MLQRTTPSAEAAATPPGGSCVDDFSSLKRSPEVKRITTNSIKKNARRIIGWIIVAKFVAIILFADFFAPYDYPEQSRSEPSAPATTIQFRGLHPVIYPKRLTDPLRLIYEEDRTRPHSVEIFVHGYQYKLLGIIPSDLHLFGVEQDVGAPRIDLLGTDNLGRDRFSRLMHAVRFSLIVCSIGVLLACLIGIVIGVTSGYSTKFVDTVLMGITDAMLSLPTLILILAARAAFPLELPPIRAAFLLLFIFALTGWAEMARLARGLVVATREREFVTAAVATGVTRSRILFRHILPNIFAPLMTQAILMLPAFLLAEIALSYLGVGLQEPEASLGNMLTAAGDLNQLRQHPISILSPAILIFIFVIGIRLLSDRKRTQPETFRTN
ncbi:MAG: ABC transporter permease [Acidobacteria bacterium]|nr:MAG: ABC transporter permease [Acidobacteriota bacterium]